MGVKIINPDHLGEKVGIQKKKRELSYISVDCSFGRKGSFGTTENRDSGST